MLHRFVANTLVVWLHTLGPFWCMYISLFGSRLYCRTVQHIYPNRDLIHAATLPPY